MVIIERLSVFTGFKEGGSEGILPHEKLNIQDFRNFISGIIAGLLHLKMLSSQHPHSNRNTQSLCKLPKGVQPYLATKFLQGV